MQDVPFFWSHGHESNELIFCMHGIGSCADAFLPQRDIADQLEHRLVAWDAPGYRSVSYTHLTLPTIYTV